MSLLAWQQLLFLIPTAVGVLLAVGAALGLADHGGDAGETGDAHDAHDAPDADGEHAPSSSDGAAALAVGRVPVLLRALLLSLSFGGTGLVASYLLAATNASPTARALISLPVALAAAWLVGGRLARALTRRLPLLESQVLTRQDLVGSVGRAVLPIGPAGGLAQVFDRHGNLHQVSCRLLATEAAVPVGGDLLLVDYDERNQRYLVSRLTA
jgi:hypothetical protein